MKITWKIPEGGGKDLPAQWEMEEMLECLLKKALPFKEGSLIVNVMGGKRSGRFPQHANGSRMGIKLLPIIPSKKFALPCYIGCRSDAIEAHLYYRPDEDEKTEAFLGSRLFEWCSREFGFRKIFHVTDDMLRNGHADKPALEKQLAEIGSHAEEPKDIIPVSPESNGSEEELEESGENSGGPMKESEERSFQGCFRDPISLYNAMVILAASFSREQPISFKEFDDVVRKELLPDLPAGKMRVAGMINFFINGGYLTRLNPGVSPSRYILSDLAYQIAEGPRPSSTDIGSAGHRHRKKSGGTLKIDMGNLMEVICKIKEADDQYKEKLKAIEAAEGSLKTLNESGLNAEEVDLNGQEANLNKRLEAIKARKLEIARLRRTISDRKAEIETLRVEAEEFKENHAQLEQLHNLLG